ncbi:hypothetical protein [Parvibaculum sp.]|uniref:hypothetical protein n=1 Tax=Parvibaculum sp. TaxID=2024848 RepID=UPI00273207FD|nr:hypothetical protein [Parvibaculum sp.]MDP2151781.1 hypothetical protein [Parvibaculum sp.]MDP3328423.1 hypothetical protein [Parvibaculum sp.]
MRRFRLEHLLVGSLLVNAGLLGFVVALLLVPGPRPAFTMSYPLPMPTAMKMPEFGLEDRLLLARLLERDGEAAAERAHRASAARAAFAEALSKENPQAEEIAEKGKALNAAMEEFGAGFINLIVTAAPKLDLAQRRALADLLLHAPEPGDFFLQKRGPGPTFSIGGGSPFPSGEGASGGGTPGDK